MTSQRHTMTYVGAIGDQSLFVCGVDGCDREVVIDRARPRMIVMREGMAEALHSGTTGQVSLSANVSDQ